MTPVYPDRQPDTKTRIGKKYLVYIISVFLSQCLVAQPTITSLSPTSGAIGNAVTITGTNFSATAADNIVLFGSVKATVSAASTTSLTVTVPAGAANEPVSVTVNYLAARSAQPFIVTPAGGAGTIDAEAFADATFQTGREAVDMATGDLNGDGKTDVAVVDEYGHRVSVLKNGSSLTTISFASPVDFTAGTQPHGIAIGDINGDGKADMAVTSWYNDRLIVFTNTSTVSTISFSSATYTASYGPERVVIRDLDGDGKNDLVVGCTRSPVISVYRNTGTGGTISFAARQDISISGHSIALEVDDIDGDGKPDIVSAYDLTSGSVPSGITVLRNTSSTGTISFATHVNTETGTSPPQDVAISDLDGDGRPDVAIVTPSTNLLSVLRNTSVTGTVSFDAKVDFTTGLHPWSLAIDDINGDGRDDIAVAFESPAAGTPAIAVYNNSGSAGNIGLDAYVGYVGVSSSQGLLVIADLTNDGKPDLASGVHNTNTLSYLRNRINEPVITSFTPTTGLGGTVVTITGAHFTGTTSVTFGGVAVSSFTVLSPTTIEAVVSSAGAGGSIYVTNLSGTAYSASTFDFIYPPFISAFSPGFGPSTTTVTITGTRFTNASAVSFGGVPALSFTVVNANTITAVVGAGASGSVSVTTPAGTGSRAGFTFLPRSPYVASFSPAAGSAGETITLTGLGFYGVTSVSFNGTQAASFTVVSSTTITAVLGNGSSGWINVNTQYNGSGGIGGFQYTTLPVISSFTPASASTGETITISGGNFTGATSITLGGTPVTSFTVVSPGVITAVVGTGATGDLSVTTATGTATLPGFTLMPPLSIPPPVISSFAPATAMTGETVTITGTGFSGATAVSLGGKPAALFTAVSSNTITAVVGNGATGDIAVTTPHGTATLGGFVYVKLPTNVIVYPNPARGIVWVKHPVSSNAMQLQVLDMTGKVHRTVMVPVGIFQTRIDIQGLLAGCYRVVLSGGGYRLSENLVVQ